MSDPMQRPSPPPPPPRDPPPDDPPARKGVSPLVWILILIAILAFGWYFYSQRGAVVPPADPTAPTTVDIGSEQEAAAERERAAADARPPRPAATTPRAPADRAPSPVARVQPAYPPAAFRAREEGTVLVRAEVDAAGNPGNVTIARRSGSRELDRAARDAVSGWKFEPAIRDGKAVAATVEVPVEFKLDTQ
jgi:periplasmic protein TonB